MRQSQSLSAGGEIEGESDLIALQRWSHEDHRPHRGHHVVGRDVFLPEIGDDEGRGMKNGERERL